MSITVTQIVDTAFLRTRYLAGSRGGGRRVVWAHTCELPDPWNWLGEGELLLADGFNFPSAAADQVRFVEKLATARLAGIALAEGMHAAPLSAAGRDAADALEFPVLETGYEVPFVAVARAVAERNSRASVAGLTKILSVYDRLHRSDRSPSRSGLLEQLETEAAADLHVIDLASGRALLESRTVLSPATSLAIVDALRQHSGPLPGHTRVEVGDDRVLVIPLSRSGAVLIAKPRAASDATDVILLQHIASIAELEITRQVQQAETERVVSADLFARILDGELGAEGAEARLEIAGFQRADRRVIAIRGASPAASLEKRLFDDGIRHLLMERAGFVLCFTDSPGAVLDRVDTDADACVGVSLAVSSTARLPDAVREARWAAEAAATSHTAVVTYGEYSAPFLPRTPEEARLVVDRVLGPIIAYDQSEGSQLVDTLEQFFAAERSWQATAQHLQVHKQTVVYRIRRIESLTGRTVRNVADQTDFFLALQAKRLLEL